MDRAARRRLERQAHRLESEEARLLGWLAKLPPVREAEDGKVNIWACDTCGRPTVARDIHEGTTPMVLGCRANVDLFDADGMPVDQPYELSDEHRRLLDEVLDEDDLVALGLREAFSADDGALFVALAHHDAALSDRVQEAITARATPEQLQRFATAVLEAGATASLRCPGSGRSCFYQLPNPDDTPWPIVELLAEPPWEWYRPTTVDQLRELDNDMLHHLQLGGLLLRKREGATGIAPSPDDLIEQRTEAPSRWTRFWRSLAAPTAP